MSVLPKRTLQELAFYYKYSANDEDCDLFVEGASDKLIIDNFISGYGGMHYPVYTMDSIDFSGLNFSALGLNAPSSRSCVVALRKYLEDQNISLANHMFIVDRDIEDVHVTPYIAGVEVTDSGALPVHLYDNKAEDQLCNIILRRKVPIDIFKQSVNEACRSIYLLRAASARLSLSVRILSPRDFISGTRAAGYSLDLSGYVDRCLYASNLIEVKKDVMQEIELVDDQLKKCQINKYAMINDHDLWEVLKKIVDLSGDSSNKSARDIEDLVKMTFNHSSLKEHRLFRLIEAHLIRTCE